MKQITVRLKDGQFLREEIERIARERNVRAGVILSLVGGVRNVHLRMPKLETGEHIIKDLDGPFEIVSCTGTVSPDGCHIHFSISDRNGDCYGGHLKEGCAIFYTVELVIGIFEDAEYHKVMDANTGFEELNVKSLK